ncbi:3-hydroxyisobutyryl-CoA hydrolase, mitochondrial [Hypsizygus marmoreus]|uniref:3-hydroxyisobutyryl-CoA hydrolase n=1 Tax=Hypsizygus marmoreus TaxID=39966 RepID=A0A369JP20_HYPMA|nr:3-hydroxyisobutyryl-CoA hydrolase, mitochondrial [Hypsizygus marmoreus]
MLTTTLLKGMSCGSIRASLRTRALAQQFMMSTSAPKTEPPVLFESNLALRTYILNRPLKLNALDEHMLTLLRPKIEEWNASELCGTIVGTGVGRAFCAGGDVENVVEKALNPETRSHAVDFFKREFEMDYFLATLRKPYVAILDGHTLGGGFGLAAHAPFRIATENTVFGMPETKIGYSPDVGASYFLSRMDGELGTYLGLTGNFLRGRAVFEHGFATHYIPAQRIPVLLDRLAGLENVHVSVIDRTIEEFSQERLPEESPAPFIGDKRDALDFAFRHDRAEKIFDDLKALTSHKNLSIAQWATETLATLRMRSPTSLKVALKAIRAGKSLTLLEAFNMELKIAAAFCNGASPDFATGVHAVLVEKAKGRPQWSPSELEDVSDEMVSRFFAPTSPYLASAPTLSIPEHVSAVTSRPMKYALPTEDEIGSLVRGSHSAGGGSGISLEELLAKFNDLRQGKMGVKEKVLEVARRKCEVTDNADGNFVWLKWKHSLRQP